VWDNLFDSDAPGTFRAAAADRLGQVSEDDACAWARLLKPVPEIDNQMIILQLNRLYSFEALIDDMRRLRRREPHRS
jgi:hypothetical protein